jgi:hypothetical protein
MIIKNKILFYLLSCTWGIIMTAIGGVVALALLITSHKPKMHGYCVYFEVGKGWGGMELGIFFLVSKDASTHTKNHEHGHGFQNAVIGPVFPFLVCIPSATRYWLRECKTRRNKVIFSTILYIALLLIAIGLLFLAIFTQPWVFVFQRQEKNIYFMGSYVIIIKQKIIDHNFITLNNGIQIPKGKTKR